MQVFGYGAGQASYRPGERSLSNSSPVKPILEKRQQNSETPVLTFAIRNIVQNHALSGVLAFYMIVPAVREVWRLQYSHSWRSRVEMR
jgi:hypothetical protein